MNLSIIIVNWNSKDFLSKCIKSLYSFPPALSYEIIVIDSASYDGAEEMIRVAYPAVRFIQSDQNLGFAKANNRAFAASVGDCVLFLNPDTEVFPNAILTLFNVLNSELSPGIVGPKLLNSDGTVQLGCVKAFPSILNQLLDSELIYRMFPNARMWGLYPLFSADESPSPVDVISGACMMMKRTYFTEIGQFTTAYFMYSEDVDLCLKSVQTRRKNYYVPTAHVIHHGGGSTSQSKSGKFSSVMMVESRWRYFRRNRSSEYAALYRITTLGASLMRTIVSYSMWRLSSGTAHHKRWETSTSKWLAILRWTIGLEQWAARR